ncbi:MAG: hypothetical protein LKI39_02740 [Bacteroides sp.]|nr:hypothetical protein [Bacteroides sp.]
MKRLIYIIAIFLIGVCLASCKSPQKIVKTEEKTEIKGSDSVAEKKTKVDSSNLEIRHDLKVIKEQLSNFSFDFQQKTTNWSAPDSEGHQYKTKTSEMMGKKTGNSKSTENMQSKTSIDYKALAAAMDSVYKKRNYQMKQEAKTEIIEKHLSWWQSFLMWSGRIAWVIFIIGIAVWLDRKTNWLGYIIKFVRKVF